MTIDRRKLFQLSSMAGLGFAGSHLLSRFGGLSGLAAHSSLRHIDAYGAIKDALLGGPSLIAASTAMAQGGKDVGFFEFKVFRGLYQGWIGLPPQGYIDTKAPTHGAMLKTLGLGDAHPNCPVLNRWFGTALFEGRTDGKSAGAMLPGTENLVATPAEIERLKKSIVVVRALNAVGEGPHDLKNLAVSGNGEVGFALQSLEILNSPFGILALNSTNRVFNAAGSVVSIGRNSSDAVSDFQSAVAQTWSSSADPTFIKSMDDLTRNAEFKKLRDQMAAGSESLKKTIASLESVPQMAARTFQPELAQGRFNPVTGGDIANAYMMGQLFSAGIVTNASLTIDVDDLNAKNMDIAVNIDEDKSPVDAIMQLGVSAHLLAKATLAAGKTAIIVIDADVGRGDDNADSGTKNTTVIIIKENVRDTMNNVLFAPAVTTGLNLGTLGNEAWAGQALKNENGTPASAQKVNFADVQRGIIKLVADERGVPWTPNGPWVNIKEKI